MLENSLIVKVDRDKVVEATRFLAQEGWTLHSADVGTEVANLTVRRGPALLPASTRAVDLMRDRLAAAYGLKKRVFFHSLPVGRQFDSVYIKTSSTSARNMRSGTVFLFQQDQLVEVLA